jgi:amino acid transporter
MQITGMFIFLGVWLLILWIGSMLLEATGMERGKARFQALSALSNTGFTTRQAEDIVEHPKRRTIVSWLIFLGCVGITAFIFIMILYVKAGIVWPSVNHIIIIAASIVVFILLIWTGIIGKLTNAILKLFRKTPVNEEVLHQAGDYSVVRVKLTEKTAATLGSSQYKNVTVLAIERGEKVISQPKDSEALQPGDHLLCYGKMDELNRQ